MVKAARSFEFDQYLEQLRLANLPRYQRLVKAEQLFMRSWYERLVHEEMLFDEQMSGFEEAPAGRSVKAVMQLSVLDSGDWSWKPERDRLLGKEMVTFRGVPPSQAELLAIQRSTPKVQYGLGTEQTREQFWESSEVERAKMKRDFLAHLPR